MDVFLWAKDLYRDGQLLLAAIVKQTEGNDLLAILCEELLEDLFELKQTVIDRDEFELLEVAANVQATVTAILRLLEPPIDGKDEKPS